MQAPRPFPSFRSRLTRQEQWALALLMLALIVGGFVRMYQRQNSPAAAPRTADAEGRQEEPTDAENLLRRSR